MAPARWRCPYGKCEGNGFIYDEELNTATDCPCRPQMIAAGRASRLRARIPRRYEHISFDTPPVTDIAPTVVRIVRRFTEQLGPNLDAGRGLWFQGPNGTGKTSLAMLVSKQALASGRSVAIYSVPRMLNELRDTFDDDADLRVGELIDRLAEVDLLHLDDLGAERSNPWVLEQLYAIVDARYEGQRSTIITTNLEEEQLVEQVGARTVSRLTEMCDMIPVHGADHRRTVGLRPPSSTPMAPPANPPTDPPSWQSPATAANLQRPDWPSPDEPPIYARPRRGTADSEPGMQGSTRRGAPDA